MKLEKAEKPPGPATQVASPVTQATTSEERHMAIASVAVSQPVVKRVVELQGRGYRVVFTSEDDALRLDRFRSLSGAQVSIRGSSVVVYVKMLGKPISIQAKSIEELG